jgi:hypothetical protein
MKKDTPKPGNVIEIDEARIRDHLGELVRGSVEETLNALLDAEADALWGAKVGPTSMAVKPLRMSLMS